MPILRERETQRERCNVRVLIICICLSVPTNNETVNLVLLQKHVVDEKYSVWFSMENILLTILQLFYCVCVSQLKQRAYI